MGCPFEEEQALSRILESRKDLNEEITSKVEELKKALTPEQRTLFNQIDDLLQSQITFAQQDTLREIHCPTCRRRNKKCQ